MGKNRNKSQGEELKKLVLAVNKTNTLLQQDLDKQDTKKKGDDKRKETAQNTRKRGLVTAKAMYGVNKITSAATTAMRDALNSSLKLQQTALGRGMDLTSVMEASKVQTEAFAGKLTGFGTAVEIGYEQFESGLKSTNHAMNELALYTKLTGGNSKKLLKSITKLTAGMSVSDDQQTALGTSIQALSQNFGLTTEELVDSLKGLDNGMRTFKILGIGMEMAQAGATLTAAMGKQAGTMGTDLLSTLTSAEGMYTAAALGVTEERLALLTGEGDATTNALNMVEKAGKIAKDRIDQMVSGGMDPALAIQKLEETLGKGVGEAYRAYNQISQEADRNGRSVEQQFAIAREQQKKNQAFTNSWNTFKDQVFSPMKETIMKLTAGLLDWASTHKPILVKIAQGLVWVASGIAAYMAYKGVKALGSTAISMVKGGGKGLVGGAKAVGGAGKGMLSGIMKMGKFIVGGLFKFGKFLLPMLWTGLTTALAAIPFFGWVILALGLLIYIFKDQIWEALKGIWKAIEPIAQTVWTAIKDLWTSLKYYAEPIMNILGYIFKGVWGVIKAIWKGYKWIATSIADTINYLWGKMKGFFEWIFSPLTGLLDALRSSWIGRQLFGEKEEDAAGDNTNTSEVKSFGDLPQEERVMIVNELNQRARLEDIGAMAGNLTPGTIDSDSALAIQRTQHEELMEGLDRIATEQGLVVAGTDTQAALTAQGNYDRKNQTRPNDKRGKGN